MPPSRGNVKEIFKFDSCYTGYLVINVQNFNCTYQLRTSAPVKVLSLLTKIDLFRNMTSAIHQWKVPLQIN